MEALSKMPREQAIEGALAFQGLSYVPPFHSIPSIGTDDGPW
jgi:hypothetical protein